MKSSLLAVFLSGALTGFLLGCQAPQSEPERASASSDAWIDPSPHTNQFAEINGVRLNYLDWGGDGDLLLFLHGFSASPHDFDDIATAFTDSFRVMALAVRGHGQSGGGDRSVDVDTLVDDLGRWLDYVGYDRAILAGHSMAGYHMTRFAELYPERVEALVYLDAGYNHTKDEFSRLSDTRPAGDRVSDDDLKSLDTFRAFYKRYLVQVPWSDAIEASIRDRATYEPDGHVNSILADTTRLSRWFSALGSYRGESTYEQITAPVLGIFSLYGVESYRANMSDSLRTAVQAWIDSVAQPIQSAAINRFRTELPHVRVIELPDTHHYVFLHRPDTVVKAMKEFLQDEL